MFCWCVDSTPAIPNPTPPPFPNAMWSQLCMNLLWKISLNWEEFWLTCMYLWHNIAIDFPNNHILFLNNYVNLLVNHDVPICFSFGERWEHDKVNIARRSVHVLHYSKNVIAFSCICSLFLWLQRYLLLGCFKCILEFLCTYDKTKSQHMWQRARSKPTPPTTLDRPARSVAEEINIASIMLHLRRQDLSVPSNYFVHKIHSECAKKIVAT
jgi:hypothetical protein